MGFRENPGGALVAGKLLNQDQTKIKPFELTTRFELDEGNACRISQTFPAAGIITGRNAWPPGRPVSLMTNNRNFFQNDLFSRLVL